MALNIPRTSLLIGILVVLSPVSESSLIHDILSAAAALFAAFFGRSPDCQFTCQTGTRPQPRPGHSAESNGCGTFGISVNVDGFPGFTDCCNAHDLCYDRCGSDKLACDNQFSDCLAFICETADESDDSDQQTCTDLATLANTAVAGPVGCVAFKQSQDGSCICET